MITRLYCIYRLSKGSYPANLNDFDYLSEKRKNFTKHRRFGPKFVFLMSFPILTFAILYFGQVIK